MTKKILALLVFVAISSWCFAQQPAAPAGKAISGKVESISMVNSATGTKSEIVVVDEKGTKSTILLKSTTTVYDTGGKGITLDKVVKGMKVQVRYLVTKEGVNEAGMILLMK